MTTSPQWTQSHRQFEQARRLVGIRRVMKSGRVSLIDFIIPRDDIKILSLFRLNSTAKDRQKNVEIGKYTPSAQKPRQGQ